MKAQKKTAKKSSPRIFYKLQELSTRWERPVEELLCLALSGDLPIFIPYYGGAVSKIQQVMAYDSEQEHAPVSLHPDWAASLNMLDFSTVCQIGEATVHHAFRNVKAGLETLSFSQPMKVTKEELVIPREHVEAVEQAQAHQISETERDSLLKMIALCTLAAAGESSICYHLNGEPNYSQMAKQIAARVTSHCPEAIRSRLLWDSVGYENLRKKIWPFAKSALM